MVMVCFSEIIERKQRYRASPNVLRISVARSEAEPPHNSVLN